MNAVRLFDALLFGRFSRSRLPWRFFLLSSAIASRAIDNGCPTRKKRRQLAAWLEPRWACSHLCWLSHSDLRVLATRIDVRLFCPKQTQLAQLIFVRR